MAGVSIVKNQEMSKDQDVPVQGSVSGKTVAQDEFFVPLGENPLGKNEVKRPAKQSPETLPATEDQKERPAWLLDGFTSASFIVSLVLHLNIILLLAAIWMMQKEEPQTIGLISTIADNEGESDQLDSLLVESLTPPESQEEELKNDMKFSNQVSETSTQLSHSNNLITGSSMNGGKPNSGMKVGKAGFFGAQTRGNSFVFIVDNSGSMNGERFRRAVAELIRAINGLDKDQEFYVIFYNSVAVPMPVFRYQRLVPATDKNKRKAITWINKLGPTGGTMPQQAVMMGLKMKPQVMFFLTDGMMPRGIRTTFQDSNKRSIKTIVHTIAFQSRVGEAVLQGIAEDNKGRYRYVE